MTARPGVRGREPQGSPNETGVEPTCTPPAATETVVLSTRSSRTENVAMPTLLVLVRSTIARPCPEAVAVTFAPSTTSPAAFLTVAVTRTPRR